MAGGEARQTALSARQFDVTENIICVEFTDWPGGTPPVVPFVRLPESRATVPATVLPSPRGDSRGHTMPKETLTVSE